MRWQEEAAALKRPSPALGGAVSAALATAWILLRVVVFDESLFPLTYLLPLTVAVWTRSVRALWLMAASFAVAQTVKQFAILPEYVAPGDQDLIFYAATLVNIFAGAGVVHAVVALRERLAAANARLQEALTQVRAQADELSIQNEELTEQAEELSQQSEELSQQAEELSQQTEELTAQNEELQAHTEEIETLNDEVGRREALLHSLLDSARLTRGEEPALADVARATLGMFGEGTLAVGIYERRGTGVERQAGAGDAQVLAAAPPALVSLVLEENRTASLEDASLRPDLLEGLPPGAVGALLCAPIGTGQAPSGAICVFAGAPRRWSADHFTLVEWLALQCAHILDILRMHADLRGNEEALRKSERVKDEFLATLSHELRTPLNAITGWAQMLLSGKLDQRAARRALEVIARNADAQNRLIEDVLDVSRIVSGKLRLEAEPTDLVPVVETVVESMLLAAESKGVRVERDFRAPGAIVVGDAARLQQVFWNLLSNAVKFTPSGGTVSVSVEVEDSGATVRVSDTGQGIEPEFLPHVFERFAQHDASTSRRHSGLGLGLAIVRHLTELHGGSVLAESAGLGRGAVFTVTLPARLPEGRGPQALTADDFNGDHELRGVRLLVVDDEAEARELFRTVLARAGAEVVVATSAAEAVECLGRVQADLIVSDIGMPVTDGYSLLRGLRARGFTAPAIAVTAYGRPEEAARALAAGFQMHLAKPVLPDQLVAAASRLAREHALR